MGLDPNPFESHSMRRGFTTDQFTHGIPDKVIKLSGRSKANASEDIDQGQLLQRQFQSLKSRELRLKDVGGLGKLSSITPPTPQNIIDDSKIQAEVDPGSIQCRKHATAN